jgi:hypothetical protein
MIFLLMLTAGMQSGLSVQFDDLFKKAWEEDAVGEQEEDGT